jgi:NADH:ubiquinone oxidoreductase subunit F (NADH-binding)
MIIKELKAIQHKFGFLPDEALQTLSLEKNIPLFKIHAVASFYPHFRLQPQKGTEIKVCTDLSCHLRGATRFKEDLEKAIDRIIEVNGSSEGITVKEVSCLGQCEVPTALSINDKIYTGFTETESGYLIQEAQKNAETTGAVRLKREPVVQTASDLRMNPYQGQSDSYEALKRLVQSRNFLEIIAVLKESGLRGLGGAGFPTGLKWEIVRNAQGDEKYVVCNADESEPGTFKDRVILQILPHLMIEGMVLGALTVGARKGIIYLRHEYAKEKEVLEKALEYCKSHGILGPRILGSEFSFDLEIFESPGGYICGEETALLEALEDKRAEPRNKPPFPGTHGLFGKPTLINNVETFTFVPTILLKGAEWFSRYGQNGAKGLKFLALSGDVKAPGVYEVPLGISAADFINEYGKGIINDKKLKAFSPGGASSGFLPASMANVPLDFQSLTKVGSMLGSGAVVAIAEGRCMLDLAKNVVKFFRNESCGKCVPCRVGSEKIVHILGDFTKGKGSKKDLDLIGELSETMQLTSICGLGQAAPYPITSVIKYFLEEIDQHITKRSCPAGVCF